MVIVTGGSTGFGRELSLALAGRGYAVVLVYLDDQPGAEATVDGIVDLNGTAIAVRADLTDELDVERLFSETAATFGGVDVIVHADPLVARVVNHQAVSQLRDGGMIVEVSGSGAVTPFVINELCARGITVAGPPRWTEAPGPESAGLSPNRADIAYYVGILDSWRLGAAGQSSNSS